MKRYLIIAVLFIAACLHAEEMRKPKLDLFPDTVVLNDGTTLHGLIVRNDATTLALQQRTGEKEISKKSIRVINDDNHAAAYFADIANPSKLPPWRMVVQDFRCDDNIRSFREIPATRIDTGSLRDIPYLSFRINERVEMNVYGDPEDPVCLEFGIYERNPDQIAKFTRIAREYIAGILRSRQEVAALYSLPESGGERRVGNFLFKVLPPSAPDAYGGWWLSIYKAGKLDAARVPKADYAKVTVPFDQLNTKSGALRDGRSHQNSKFLAECAETLKSPMAGLEGFYRDQVGNLKLLFTPSSKKPDAAH